MKLVVIFLLATIPICCYASSSGCKKLDIIIKSTIDKEVTENYYVKLLKPYLLGDPLMELAVRRFKGCFQDQSKETLADVEVMINAILDSEYCDKDE
ncbi:mammaglobin-A [Psammomys obesus]|uniref:mammaglobin-A n=1 Tax=Psammomys obesus TaxID=48139 RepID=UPI002453358E|nr:mammaglobin-A [Psammomys obesus]